MVDNDSFTRFLLVTLSFSIIAAAVMLLSCPAKKVTKECGIGEALRLGAHLRAKSRALPGCASKRACGRSRTRADEL